MRSTFLKSLLVVFLFSVSCRPEPPAIERSPDTFPPTATPAAGAERDPDLPIILAYGDSLTHGYMVERNLSYPAQLQAALDQLGYRYRVVNQGDSGLTTSGGVALLEDALRLRPEIVILELGANDGLRGLPISAVKDNLAFMIEAFQDAGARVVLAGMTLPRNYSPAYIRDFEQMYVDLAEQYGADRIPFFLEGVAGDPALNLSDGIHPTGEGYAVVARTVLDFIEPLLSAPEPEQ